MSKISTEDIISIIEKSDVKLYAIGIGNQRDYNGQYLKMLAEAGKGQAYGASNADMLNEIYNEIDKFETTEIKSKKIVQLTYLFIYPLFLAILALLGFIYFRNLRGDL